MNLQLLFFLLESRFFFRTKIQLSDSHEPLSVRSFVLSPVYQTFEFDELFHLLDILLVLSLGSPLFVSLSFTSVFKYHVTDKRFKCPPKTSILKYQVSRENSSHSKAGQLAVEIEIKLIFVCVAQICKRHFYAKNGIHLELAQFCLHRLIQAKLNVQHILNKTRTGFYQLCPPEWPGNSTNQFLLKFFPICMPRKFSSSKTDKGGN